LLWIRAPAELPKCKSKNKTHSKHAGYYSNVLGLQPQLSDTRFYVNCIKTIGNMLRSSMFNDDSTMKKGVDATYKR
jgi:hypothetical protein